MKKYISLFLLCLWALCLQAQQGSIDPENPGDPSPFYTLRINVSPASGGTPNFTKKMVAAGDRVHIDIELNKNFTLLQWVYGDSILTTNEAFYFTMPADDVVLTAQLLHSTVFDPESPDDPASPNMNRKHLVTIFATPSTAGEVYPSSFYLKQGEQKTVYAYPYSGYEFMGWYVNDELQSDNNPLVITMKDQDLAITAKFQFNPTPPNDPGVNSYDPITGELVIDRFQPGRLTEALYNLLRGIDVENARFSSVTIIGKMASADFYTFENFMYGDYVPDIMDLGQTSGFSVIPEGAFSGEILPKKIILPSCVQSIEIENFISYYKNTLEELVLYALVPPTVKEYSFIYWDEVIGDYVLFPNMVVKVPASAVPLYQAHEFWSQFPIYAIDAATAALKVELPQNTEAKYKNMSLEVKNLQSEQVRKFIITDHTSYTFDDLFQGTTYEVSVKNAQGRNLGLKNVTIPNNDTILVLSQLKQLVDLNIQVLLPNNENVTNHVRINWYSATGELIQTGTKLDKQIEGDIVKFDIELPQQYSTEYEAPNINTDTIGNETATIKCTLSPINKVTIEGFVKDSINKLPIAGAEIKIKQIIKNKFTKLFTTQTNNEGFFNIEILDVDSTEITITALDYIQQSFYKNKIVDNKMDIYLSPFLGTKLYLNLRYIPANENNNTESKDWYDYADLMFKINNLSKQNVTNCDFEYDYPQILIKEQTSVGDTLQIIIRSGSNFFAEDTLLITIGEYNRANVELCLVEQATLSVSCENPSPSSSIGLIYNSNGQLVSSEKYTNNKIVFNHLPKGHYNLISIEENATLKNLSTITDYDRFNLQETIHYKKTAITINDGQVLRIVVDSIPSLINWIKYTDETTSFTTNKTTLIAGTYLTLRTQINFLKQYQNDISDAEVVVTIPQGVSFIENALLIGNQIGEYTYTNNEVHIPLKKLNSIIRFCIIPTLEGDYTSSAYVRFSYKGNVIQQPIGSARYSVENATINANLKVAKKTVVAQGITTPSSNIELYDNNELIGVTKVKPNGSWLIEAELYNPFNLSTHNIYAKIATPDGLHFQTKQKTFLYNISNSVELKTIEMSVFEHGQLHDKIIWDFANTTLNKTYYQYTAANASFDFIVDFANDKNAKIQGVNLNIYLHEGIYNLPLNYNANIDKWEGHIPTGVMGETGNGVVNIGAEIHYEQSDEFLLDANWFHDIISAVREINSIQIESDTTDLLTQFRFAIDNNDEETINKILRIWYSDETLTDSDTLSDEELELLLIEVDNILKDTSLILSNLKAIQEMQISPSMVVTTCENIDSLQLLEEGYEVMTKTDGGKVYFYGYDENISIVDFNENFYLELKTIESNNEISQNIRALRKAISNARGDCDRIAPYLVPIDEGLYKLKENIDSINSLWGEVQNIVKGIKFQLEDNAKKIAGQIGKKIPITQRKKALIAIANVQRWTGIEKIVGFQVDEVLEKFPWMKNITTKIGGVLIGVEIYNNLAKEAELIKNLNDLYRSVPIECSKQQLQADILASDICNYGSTIVWHTLEGISWNIIQLGTVAAELAGMAETVGLSVLLASVNIIVGICYEIRSTSLTLTDEGQYYLFRQRLAMLDCTEEKPEPEEKGKSIIVIEPIFADLEAHIDPAGYVYEAVSDNRVEGVKATVYYKASREDIFGNTITEDVMWNAWDYDQENPQYTDKNGQYQWFVPQGLWQVRFEKEGYESTQSDWLPVPPPQLEVNIPIVQLTQPEVQHVEAFATAIDIAFNKYMQPALLNAENIYVVANDQVIEGSIIFKNELVSYEGEDSTYVSQLRFIPNSPFTAEQITLTISNRVRSYAGINMAETYQQTFDVAGLTPLLQADAPTASIESGSTVKYGTELYLTSATPNAQIRYTFDGSYPTCNRGLVYNGEPIILTDYKSHIRAIACAEGYDPSEISDFTYMIDLTSSLETNSINTTMITKILRDGQLLILRDGKIYNIMGQEL